jgi:hypothetical protein
MQPNERERNEKDAQIARPCKMCRERYKSGRPASFGSDPECAFPNGGPFTPNNWQCVTANAIRDLAESDLDGVIRDWSGGGDQTNVVIRLDTDCDYPPPGTYGLYVTWYKRRGRTGGMWLMGDEGGGEEGLPRPPTEAEAVAIIEHYTLYPVLKRKP